MCFLSVIQQRQSSEDQSRNARLTVICCAPSLDTFKKHLKAHLFSTAYDI